MIYSVIILLIVVMSLSSHQQHTALAAVEPETLHYSHLDIEQFATRQGRFASPVPHELCANQESSSSTSKFLWHRFSRFLIIGDSLSIGRSPSSEKVKSTATTTTETNSSSSGIPATSSWRLSFFSHLAETWNLSQQNIKSSRDSFVDGVVGLDHMCRGGSCRHNELFPTLQGALWGSRPEWFVRPPKTQQKFKETFKGGKRAPRHVLLWKTSPKYAGVLGSLLQKVPDMIIIFFTNHDEKMSKSVDAVAELIARFAVQVPAAVFVVVAPTMSAYSPFALSLAQNACELASDKAAKLVLKGENDDDDSPSFLFDSKRRCFVTRYPSCLFDSRAPDNSSSSNSVLSSLAPFTYDMTHLNPGADAVLGSFLAEKMASCLFRPLLQPSSTKMCFEEAYSTLDGGDALAAKFVAAKVPRCSEVLAELMADAEEETILFAIILGSSRASFTTALRAMRKKIFFSNNKTHQIPFSHLIQIQRRLFFVFSLNGVNARRKWESAEKPSSLRETLSQSHQILSICHKVMRLPSNCFDLHESLSTAILYDNVDVLDLKKQFAQSLSLSMHIPPSTTTTPNNNSSSGWSAENDVLDSARSLQRRKLNDKVSTLLTHTSFLSMTPSQILAKGNSSSYNPFFSISSLSVNLPLLRQEIARMLPMLPSLLCLSAEQRAVVANYSQLSPLLQCLKSIKKSSMKNDASDPSLALEMRKMREIEAQDLRSVRSTLELRMSVLDATIKLMEDGGVVVVPIERRGSVELQHKRSNDGGGMSAEDVFLPLLVLMVVMIVLVRRSLPG